MEQTTGTGSKTEEERRLPAWDSLPDIDLYMDQVLLLVDRSLRGFPGYEERGLTASMVNNYVKQGVLPSPVKKRYGRAHLAFLLIICVLKPALPISAIKAVTARQLQMRPLEQVYEDFRRIYGETTEVVAAERSRDAAEKDGAEDIWRASLRASAEQALAMRLYRERFEADSGGAEAAAADPGGGKK